MTHAGPLTRPRVYRRLVTDTSLGLRTHRLSKATLTELSHVLENAVIDHDLPGAVFTGFQRSGHWFRALRRYERLAQPRARSVAVFAAGNLGSDRDDDIVRVPLAEDSPLVEEWFLVILTTGFCAVLLGEDTGEVHEDELDRTFETIWSFDHATVTTIAGFIRDEVATFDASVADRLDHAIATFVPGPDADRLRDEILAGLAKALEVGRERFRRTALLRHRAVRELEELERSKNAFLSAVSHELRTPLTVIRGLALTLQRLGASLSPEDRAGAEQALVTHSERLALLLDELLDLDRLVRGVLVTSPDRVELVAVTRATLATLPGGERVTLSAPGELCRHVDGGQYDRIVVNLVGNALKYAADGPVHVVIEPASNGGARLTVDDQGPGVPVGERERILEPFVRLDDQHPQPGTGIGLALVAEFARLHGGFIEVADAPSGGARFVVVLGELASAGRGAG